MWIYQKNQEVEEYEFIWDLSPRQVQLQIVLKATALLFEHQGYEETY